MSTSTNPTVVWTVVPTAQDVWTRRRLSDTATGGDRVPNHRWVGVGVGEKRDDSWLTHRPYIVCESDSYKDRDTIDVTDGRKGRESIVHGSVRSVDDGDPSHD